MKKQFAFILIASIMAGCSSDAPEGNDDKTEQPQT